MSRTLVFIACLATIACDGKVDGDAGPADGARVDGGPADASSVDAGRSDAGPIDAGGVDSGSTDAGTTASCVDGVRNGDESDIDCGGTCGPCGNAASCAAAADCLSARCVDDTCVSPEGTHPDIIRVDDVVGRVPGGRGWADSYSVDGRCYCESTFDHNISDIPVETPVGTRTVRQVCDAIGPGPGSEDRPLYNDIQCGNGPANDAGDEDDCPGRVDIGPDGCGHIGPRWDLSVVP